MLARNSSDEFADSPDSIDEPRLVARIRAGDPDAFEQLFLAYTPRLCDFVCRYTQSQDEAQEIVQDLFFKLWRNREHLTVRGTFANYLYLAARNGARNWLAHRRVVRQWQEKTVHDPENTAVLETIDQQFLRAESLASIEQALAELPERRRVICVLRWTQSLSYAEIAQRLGISEKTVETQLNRAVHDIRTRFTESP